VGHVALDSQEEGGAKKSQRALKHTRCDKHRSRSDGLLRPIAAPHDLPARQACGLLLGDLRAACGADSGRPDPDGPA